ncbi:MAG: 2-amino-4-hydroxy-6-hydroxymethyldihydropteridine diphosphokinase [Gammaproteobacteria bacterium]|nr:2-amino-4-hydroxy-6-hydroxymethyldihydropteridine diphosphokinase [Gammaproteobacteria bacterium]
MSVTVYLGLGSNLGDSVVTLHSAIDELDRSSDFLLKACSSIYRSKPLDDMPQPDYYNMVIEGITDLEPEALLDFIQGIENNYGRERKGERWQARTLDIDILLYGQQIIKTSRLLVPHIGIAERDFVLFPLNELAPDLMIPLLGTVAELTAQCENRGLVVTERE